MSEFEASFDKLQATRNTADTSGKQNSAHEVAAHNFCSNRE